MKSLRALIVRLCGLFQRKQQDREFAEEMASHLAMHIEDNLRSGLSPVEARRNALIKLGGMDKTIEEHRDRRGFQWFADMQRNFRYAFRRLVKSPLLSIVVILSLGLGIGSNTAIFSLMHQRLLRSLPVEKPEEIALGTVPGIGAIKDALWHTSTTDSGNSDYIFSYPGFRDLELRQQRDVAEIAGFRKYQGVKLAYQDQPTSGSILMVSGGYCSLLRLHPFMGRTLVSGDDLGAGNPVAMLGYGYWQNTLGGQPDVLNQSIRISGQVFTIVGVAPKEFQGTTVGMPPDVIIPLATNTSFLLTPLKWTVGLNGYNDYWVYLLARIRSGVTREQAAAFYDDVHASIVEKPAVGM